jgi:dTDP-4-dehydrorhamnose 3,5-epimerase
LEHCFIFLVLDKKQGFSIKLEKHQTKSIVDQHINGSLTVVWRDWDNIIENHPKMVYISSVKQGEVKGPHLHIRRNSYFVCVHGKVVFIIRDEDGKYHEIVSGEDDPVLVFVPRGASSAHINLSQSVSRVLALADIAWRPNDDEMKNITFDDYDWKKWKD